MQIRIDPTYALKSVPISGENFDVLAGLGIHEGLHSHCQSDNILSRDSKVYQGLVTMGEEIYIDNFAKNNFPILGKYVHSGREAYKPPSNLVNWDDIWNTWGAIAIYGMMPEGKWLVETHSIAMLQL